MERYLRFYIKFHGYVMAISTILGTILMTIVCFTGSEMFYPLEQFYEYRFMGSGALLFGILWLFVGIALFYGIYKEVKKWIYPFAVAFMVDLFLLFVRDIFLIWYNSQWYQTVLLNPLSALVALYVVLHIMLTLVALGKLFDHDPVEPTGMNFVRFKSDDRPSASGEEDVVSLVVG
ncbi:uncharacterized protein LOC128738859 [Sabethes cyaneus]|uniref:uncharacterized protein LOC128738859 n=1 Tax=Sabethes cyaneus TaxID=53552 RepID=UPI00221E31DA|nr:uncharacterized protein LOC128738859 [Sabethes cyaneus]